MTEHTHTYEQDRDMLPGVVYRCACGKTTTARGLVEYEAFNGDPCESIAGLLINRASNTGGGRPSDAARYVVSLHDSLGCDGLRARYEEGANSQDLGTAAGSLGLAPGELSGRGA